MMGPSLFSALVSAAAAVVPALSAELPASVAAGAAELAAPEVVPPPELPEHAPRPSVNTHANATDKIFFIFLISLFLAFWCKIPFVIFSAG